MHSIKYYDKHAGVWIRKHEDGSRQRSVSPGAPLANPGASASGLVVHRETLQRRSPIATPRGSWVAADPFGVFEILDRKEYVLVSPPGSPSHLSRLFPWRRHRVLNLFSNQTVIVVLLFGIWLLH